ncbi:MAG TPA: nicotinate-nucleotide adenylyltransferase [Bryobacteraceae bacterium]
MKARIAIFGGTFDPVHDAHLAVAREAADTFDLDRVLFVPAKSPPHKLGDLHACFEHRMRMVELACAADRRFEPSRIEDRPGRSYSFDTVMLVRQKTGPETRLFFLIGADAFAEIRSWHRWEELIKLVEFIVVSRPRRAFDIPEGTQVHRLDTLELPVSSSSIRKNLGQGEIDVPIPDAVRDYIREQGLYLPAPPTDTT